jgi:hypothetical protein
MMFIAFIFVNVKISYLFIQGWHSDTASSFVLQFIFGL